MQLLDKLKVNNFRTDSALFTLYELLLMLPTGKNNRRENAKHGKSQILGWILLTCQFLGQKSDELLNSEQTLF